MTQQVNRPARGQTRKLAGRVAMFHEFVVLEELKGILDFCAKNEGAFHASQIAGPTDKASPHRRSRVLLQTGPWRELIASRIAFYFPRVLEALNHPRFEVQHVEAQLTASSSGDYFRMHNDSTHADRPSREITYVLYVHREPAAFTGGELRVFDTEYRDEEAYAGALRTTVRPRQGTIIFFDSALLHEVQPVHSNSHAFLDSRLTLNGWLHR